MGIVTGGLLAGAGSGALQALDTAQKQYGAEELQKMKIDADKELQASMQNFSRSERVAGQEFTAGESAKSRAQTETLQSNSFVNAEHLQRLGFDHAEIISGARQAFDRREHEANRNLTREQIIAQEKIAAANNKTALTIANIGGTIQQDTQGNVLMIGKDGKSKPVTGADGKPLVGFKDLTPAAKAYSDVLKAQLVDLDRMEIAAQQTMDEKQLASIKARRAALSGELLNVLTGGIGAAGAKAEATKLSIPTAAADHLKKNPGTAEEFDAKYGPGSSASILTTVAQGSAVRGVVNKQVGYAEALDEADPKKPRQEIPLEERDRMAYP